MTALFSGPEQLADGPSKVPSFRSTQYESMSSRDERFQAALAARIEDGSRAFRVRVDARMEGDRIVLHEGDRTLEFFLASDSLWWTNHQVANREWIPEWAGLPSPDEAVELADRELRRVGLDSRYAAVSSVHPIQASVVRVGREPETLDTALDVNYAFSLSDAPVFGPGAKIKVTLAGGGEVAQVLRFWRDPEHVGTVSVISPDEAYARFCRDLAFVHLRGRAEAAIKVSTVTFGYFALPPGDFQRFYVPVYAIAATASTPELPRYDFRRYVIAVEMKPSQIKMAGIVANPSTCRVI